MYGIVKCLPMSRRKSIRLSSPSQSRLLTIDAPPGPARSRGTARAGRALPRRSPRACRGRAGCAPTDRPDGSPIIPVPPPTSATGRPPKRCSRSSPKIGTRLADVQRWRRRVEADVAGDRRAGREPRGEARRGRVEDAPPVELGQEPAEAASGAGRRASRSSQAYGPGRLDPPGGGHPVHHAPYAIVRPQMQTSLARRQRHRRALGQRPRGRNGSGSSAVVGAIVVAPLRRLVPRAPASGLIVAVSAYNHYAAGLPDPAAQLKAIAVRAADDRLRPDRQGRAGPPRATSSASSSPSTRSRRRDHRRDDRDRGQGLLDQPRLRPGGHRLGRPRHAQRRTRAAPRRSPSSSSAPGCCRSSAFEGSTYERKIREIIQSIRLTQAFPGDEGKQQIITAYLNQNFYGNQSYGVKAAAKSYFGKALAELTLAQDAILAAIPQSPTKFDLVRNADAGLPRGRRRRAPTAPSSSSSCPHDSEVVQRRNQVLDLMKTRSVLTGAKHTAAEYDAAKKEPVDPRAAGLGDLEGAPLRVAGPRTSSARILCPETPDRLRRSTPAATRSPRRSTGRCSRPPRSGSTWRRGRPTPRTRRAVLTRQEDPARPPRRGSSACAATTSTTRRPAVIDYRTGAGPRLRRQRQLHRQGQQRSSSPSSTSCPTAGASPARRSSRSTTSIGIDDHTLTASTMFMDVVTDFGRRLSLSATQADKLERGPVRLRSALQFSLNIPAIKAGIMTGLDHVFNRTKDFGLIYPKTAVPGRLDGHRHPRDPPDRPARRVRRDRQRRRPHAAPD